MGTVPTIAAENIYCRCRMDASKYNDRLKSREGAAELLGISVSSLADYELGNTKVVPVDKVNLMAELYNAPQLRNQYCANECPLGKYSREISEMPSERALLRLKNAFDDVEAAADVLSKMMDDGVISDDEKTLIPYIRDNLLKARQRIDENLAALEKASKIGKFS